MVNLFGAIMTLLESLWPAIRLAAPYIVLLAAADGLRRSGQINRDTVLDAIADGHGRLTGSGARHLIYGSVLAGAVATVATTPLIPAAILVVLCVHGLVRMKASPLEHPALRYGAAAAVPLAIVAAVTMRPLLQALCVIQLYGTVFWRI